jgi:acyl-CoA dehydrogenase
VTDRPTAAFRACFPELPPVEAFLHDSHAARIADIAGVVAERIAPRPESPSDDAARSEARGLLGVLAESGALEAIREQDLRLCCLVRESLGAASPLADAVFALQALGTTPILLGGDDDQRRRFAEPALAGRAIAAFAMTEPDAGSDVASMSTSAVRDGSDWVLEGTKTFISNAGIADFYTVFASTDRTARGRGITAFVVPADAPGFRFVRPLVMASPHPLGEIAFEACRIPDANRLGPEGGGFKLGLATLDRLRSTVAAAACGMGRRALEEAIDHAKTRRQFDRPIAEFQLVQEKLARMSMQLDASRLLTYRAARAKDGGAERVTREAAAAKAFATEAAQRIVDDAVQILGGRGVMADHPVDRLYRSVRSLRIYEGTTEVQHLILAGELLKERDA